jgi:DNA-binding NtrC family response regulator
MKTRILIVEDQFIEANNLKLIIRKAGYDVCSIARSVPEALIILEQEKPDMVLLDIQLDGQQTGIDLAAILHKRNIAFVYLSANSNKQTLDAAKATNPYGFLVKPFRQKDVLVMLDVACYLHKQKMETLSPLSPQKKSESVLIADSFDYIIGGSNALKEVLNKVKVVANSDVSVLILGESGTGKELVAKAIQQSSTRKLEPFVVVNCGALPQNLIESELFGHERGSFTGATEKRIGKFEQADGGTIFLDEIGELPLDLQVKFLRVLQEKEIESIGGKKKKLNIRVIAATNKDLEEAVANGQFRMDLFYRLNIFPIWLPPLRERAEDIEVLAKHFLRRYTKKENKSITGFSDAALASLLQYGWPGNIRELENIIERSVLLSSGSLINTILLPHSKKAVSANGKAGVKTINENERDHIISVLTSCNWKIYGKGGAAEALEINPTTLHSRMKKLDIKRGDKP